MFTTTKKKHHHHYNINNFIIIKIYLKYTHIYIYILYSYNLGSLSRFIKPSCLSNISSSEICCCCCCCCCCCTSTGSLSRLFVGCVCVIVVKLGNNVFDFVEVIESRKVTKTSSP